MIVHLMQYGLTPHPMPMPPAKWPKNHMWVGQEGFLHLTCEACIEAFKFRTEPIYEIFYSDDGKRESIKCLRCGRTSHNLNDVNNRYCGYCHAFLDDIWPPARKAWLESGKPVMDYQI